MPGNILNKTENTDESLIETDGNTSDLESKASQMLQRMADSGEIKSCTKDAFYLDSFPVPQIAQNHPLGLYKVRKFQMQSSEEFFNSLNGRILAIEKGDGVFNLYAKFKPETLFKLTSLSGEGNGGEYQWEIINTDMAGVYQDFVECLRFTFPHDLLVLMDITTPKFLEPRRNSQMPVIEKGLLKELKLLDSENIRLDFSKKDHRVVFDIINSMRLPDLKKISIVSSRIPVNFFQI